MGGKKGKIIHRKRGEKLKEFILSHTDFGGREVIISGQKGTGKTTLALKLAEKLVGKEYVIWRGRPIDLYVRIPDWQDKVNVLVHKDVGDVQFKLRVRGQRKMIPIDVQYSTYSDAKDVVRLLKKDKLNIVYEPTFFVISKKFADHFLEKTNISLHDSIGKPMKGAFFWFELDYQLLFEKGGEWASVFLDEAHQVYPENPEGLHYHFNRYVLNAIDDFREGLISHFLITHSVTQIYHKLREKMPFRIYLQGAPIERKLTNMKNKNVAMNIEKGRAIIEHIGSMGYGSFYFKPYPNTKYSIVMTGTWKGKSPTVEKDHNNISAKVREVFIQEGPEKALELLITLRKLDLISRSHYYRLKAEIGGI